MNLEQKLTKKTKEISMSNWVKCFADGLRFLCQRRLVRRESALVLVPVAGLETAERFSLASAGLRNCLQECMLRSQKQNAKKASERTKAKENEKVLSSIVIKNIGFLRGGSFSECLEPSCSARRWRAPHW